MHKATDFLIRVSLRGKILFLACTCTLISIMLVGTYNYYISNSIAQNIRTEKLANETRLVTQSVQNMYSRMLSDLFILSQTPPITGIIRSKAHAGIDPLDGSSTEIWRQRLATIFTSVLSQSPNYTQIRYVGISDGGREIVRANQKNGNIHIVDNDHLQKKATEPYFKEALLLKSGEHLFSDVTYIFHWTT